MAEKRDPAQVHNELAPRLIREMWEATGTISALNVLAESLLLGVGMFNFPADPRRQAIMIQEIADGAVDRAKAIRKAPLTSETLQPPQERAP